MTEILLAVLCLLQVLDIISTKSLLDSGKGREANPVMKWCIDRLGTTAGLIVPKVVIMVALVLAAPHVALLFILCAFYAGVVVNNYELMK